MDEPDERAATKLVKGGRRREWRGTLVNVAVERASTSPQVLSLLCFSALVSRYQ